MLCPKCNGETSVTDSRSAPNNSIRRRRECVTCRHRFTTRESTVNAGKVVEQRRAALRAFKARLTPEERQARNKRDHTRRAARAEAKLRGVPVQDLYREWGVE